MPATRMLLAIAAALALGAPQHPVTMRHVQPELFSTTGALVNALSDIDGDGDADLFVGFNGAPNRLYRNDGGLFVEIGAAAGVADARATRAAAFGDWDADGDPDLLVGFAPGAGPVLRLYRNDNGRFVDATVAADLRVDSGAVRQPVWVDYDADDDLDLFVAFRDRANALFRNTNGRLVDIAAEVGLADARRSVGAVWADLDADGDLDVVVGNMDGDANGVFRNDRGRFTDVAPEWALAGGGRALGERTSGTVRPCVADMDGDGRFDIITANYGPAGLFLRRDSAWVDAGAQWGIAVDGRYDTCAPADVDNDGRLDLYLNGTVTQGRNWPDYLYRNAGMRFDNAMPDILASIPADHGAQWADLNGDGAVDLALTGQGPHAVLATILPDSVARRSLSVRVLDGRGRATRAGAEVRVYAAGTRRVLATRLVDAGSGYDAQSDLPVHIGLPTTGPVDIEIAWPAAGQRRISRQLGVRVDGRRIVEIRIPSAQDVPAERLAARSKFQDSKFGLFIHWGVYSQMGQGEWVMQNRSIAVDAYEWLASAFNPTKFDAREWVATAKAAGMRYITITARHHDGFSMFASKTSRYNIVDWTPFKRDALRELADACRAEGIQLFFYYSQLDWHHTDYWPRGGTGNGTGRPDSGTWSRYLDFMDAQLTELLTNYGPIGGIWFDGMWDKPDADWRLERTYALIHRLQPSALIVPNHHKAPLPGEDVQTFEQDLPGSNTSGWNTKEIGALPLETSLTMNGAWGFNITDRRFKSTRELLHYLVRAAGAGANLLLNVGPRPDGTIQPEAVERLRAMGDWLRANGTSIYSTRAGPVPPRAWGVTTQRGDSVFVHVLDWPDRVLALPNIGARVLSAAMLSDGTRLEFAQSANGVTITLPPATGDAIDRVVVLRIAVASRGVR